MENNEHVPKYPLQTLSNALEILNYIKDCPSSEGVTLTDLSNDMKIGKSSAHRILDTLLAYNFVEKTTGTQTRYRLSWGAFRVGSSVPKYHTLNSSGHVHMLERLSSKFSLRADLCVLNDYETTVMCSVGPRNTKNSQNPLGERKPLYATAVGKLFMMEFSEEEIRQYFKNITIKKYTANTILNYIDFLDELQKIRQNGYSTDNCEFEEDVVCIAMPIRDYTHKIIASMSISGSSAQMTPDKLEEIKPELKSVCDEISDFLGANV